MRRSRILPVFIFCFIAVNVALADPAKYSFQLLQSQYLTESAYDEQGDSYSDLVGEIDLRDKNRAFEYRVNLKGIQDLSGRDEGYLTSNELYVSYEFSANSSSKNTSVAPGKITFGRKLMSWSYHDQLWRQSMWQPTFSWNLLSPEVQGLTGLFYQINSWGFSATLMASPLFLPNQGPNIRTMNGKLVSGNRWFNNNIESVQIGQNSSALHYEIEKPNLEDVLFNETLAVNFKRISQRGLLFNLSVARKPSESLYFGLRPVHDVSISDIESRTYVKVFPRVIQHNLLSLDMGWQFQAAQVFVTYIEERPINFSRPEAWVNEDLPNQKLLGVTFSGKVRFSSLRLTPTLSYQTLSKERSSESAEFLDSESEALLRPSLYEDAVMVGLRADMSEFYLHGGSAELLLVRDLAVEGDALVFKMNLSQNKNVDWKFGFDLVGAEQGEKVSLFSQFRSNDRVWGGVGLAF